MLFSGPVTETKSLDGAVRGPDHLTGDRITRKVTNLQVTMSTLTETISKKFVLSKEVVGTVKCARTTVATESVHAIWW